MAKLPTNIERLPGKGHYTGYGSGMVWRIERASPRYGYWQATCSTHCLVDRTLAEIGEAIKHANDYLLMIGLRAITAGTLAEVSAAYCAMRDASGEGASTFPVGLVYRGHILVGQISYNGRIWAQGGWVPGAEPIYDPYATPST